jgi:hypothetical protein
MIAVRDDPDVASAVRPGRDLDLFEAHVGQDVVREHLQHTRIFPRPDILMIRVQIELPRVPTAFRPGINLEGRDSATVLTVFSFLGSIRKGMSSRQTPGDPGGPSHLKGACFNAVSPAAGKRFARAAFLRQRPLDTARGRKACSSAALTP